MSIVPHRTQSPIIESVIIIALCLIMAGIVSSIQVPLIILPIVYSISIVYIISAIYNCVSWILFKE